VHHNKAKSKKAKRPWVGTGSVWNTTNGEAVQNSDTTGFSRVEFQFQPNTRTITILRAAPPRVEGKDGAV